MFQVGSPCVTSLLDLPLLPSRHVLGIALLQRSDVFALSSAADALKQLGLEASSLAGAFVIVSEAGGLRQRKLGACANGDASTIVVDYDGKSNVALAVDSVLDRDLTEQQWRQVEADYCSRLLAGHAEPVTLRQVAGAFARLTRLHRCWLLLRNAITHSAAPATPAGGGPVSATLTINEALREQLLQALKRPAFNDCMLLDWLGRVVPWDEGLAMELASSRLQQLWAPQDQQPQQKDIEHHAIKKQQQQQDRRQQNRRQPAWPVSAEESGDPRLARRLAPRAAAEAGTAAVAVEALPGEGQRDLAAGQKVEAQEAEGWTATGQQRTQGRKEAEGQKAGSDVQHPQHLLLGSMAADAPAPPADLMPQRPAGPHGTPLAPPLSPAAAGARARGCALSGAAAMPDTLGTADGALLASGVGPQQQQQQEDRHRGHGRRSPPASYAAGQQDGLASTAGGQQLTTGWSASGPSAVAAAARQPHTAVLDPPPSRVSEQKRSRECAAEARHDDGSHRSHRRRSRSPAGRGGRGRNGSPSRSQSRSRSRSRSHSPLRSPSGSRPPSRSRSRSRSTSPALEHARAHAHAPASPSPGEGQQSWKVRAEELAWARQLHVWLLRQPNRTAVLPLILRSKMGVPGWLLSTTGRNPYSFWKGHPALWELLPGAPPSLRARPAAAAAATHARERTAAAPAVAGGGGRWPPEAERESTATLPVPVAAGEGRPPSAMLAAAQMEVAYIRRLYTMCVTDHPKGIPVRNFTRYGVEVPVAVLRGRRMTAFLKSYEDAGVLELNRGTSLPVVVRAVAGPRAEAALQEVCQRLLKQHGRL